MAGIQLRPDAMNGQSWGSDMTANEADALADELRAAANSARSHNRTVSRVRFP